ncbi:hypothetical protein HPB48_022849 [Haemaphysalis longicornis]|uniref:Uncharacterized protein n=1 Tax=Haemaphysalis longicornis TaxID=44386 RepID=A0A9J6GPH8_HAELO|nr:hypothetical protein HPB48_022849 [Haemaphysalis longicornis]
MYGPPSPGPSPPVDNVLSAPTSDTTRENQPDSTWLRGRLSQTQRQHRFEATPITPRVLLWSPRTWQPRGLSSYRTIVPKLRRSPPSHILEMPCSATGNQKPERALLAVSECRDGRSGNKSSFVVTTKRRP